MMWVQEIWPQWHGCRRAGRLVNSATSQAWISGFELAHCNAYPLCELLERAHEGISPAEAKLQDLHDWGSSRTSERSLGEGLVSMVQQKQATLNQTDDSMESTFASKAGLSKGWTVWRNRDTPQLPRQDFLFNFYFLFSSWEEVTGAEGGYGRTGKWVGLACVLRNLQRIDKDKREKRHRSLTPRRLLHVPSIAPGLSVSEMRTQRIGTGVQSKAWRCPVSPWAMHQRNGLNFSCWRQNKSLGGIKRWSCLLSPLTYMVPREAWLCDGL